MNYEYILFDLDGTLTDSGVGITNAVMYALQKFGIQILNRSELYKFIGPPLGQSFKNYYGFSEEETEKAVEYYREYYKDKGLFENFPYDGIEELLKTLKDKGKILLVATSKPEVFARRILEHFNMAKYFNFIGGSDMDGTRSQKAEVINYVLESSNILDLSKAIMVGDREHDIIGAKKAGISSIGVLFGYGDREELEIAGADFIAATVEGIGEILLA